MTRCINVNNVLVELDKVPEVIAYKCYGRLYSGMNRPNELINGEFDKIRHFVEAEHGKDKKAMKDEFNQFVYELLQDKEVCRDTYMAVKFNANHYD
jgi:hypothetical protein